MKKIKHKEMCRNVDFDVILGTAGDISKKIKLLGKYYDIPNPAIKAVCNMKNQIE